MIRKLIFCLFLAPGFVQAQTGLSTPIPFGSYGFLNGKSTYNRPDSPEEGTYLFPKDPATANITLRNGRKYAGVKVMINLLENEMIFADSSGQLYESLEPVARIEFPVSENIPVKMVFQTGFPPVDYMGDKNFYKVLADGALMLLEANRINYNEKYVLGKSVPTRIYDSKQILYAYDKNKKQIKKLPKNSQLEELFAGNAKMETYLGTHKIKSRSDIVDLFNYYNAGLTGEQPAGH